MSNQRDLAQRLRTLHRPGEPLLLINVWDALSARVLEDLGFPAIATSSAGVAFVDGYPDGEKISRKRMLDGVQRVTRAVRIPVSADLEAAYGTTVEDARRTAEGAIAAGAVGLNFEDADERGGLVDEALQCERIAAMHDAGERAGVPLVINARTDLFLAGIGESDEWRLEQAIRRGNRYLEAGAACAFVPGVADESLIQTLAREIHGPINILAGAATPSVGRLAQLGVARISVGSASIGYAYAAFRDMAQSVRESGSFGFAAERISHADMNALFQR